MGRNQFLPLQVCNLCTFSTKNRYLFRRHRNRCRRQHKRQQKSYKISPIVEKSLSATMENEGELCSPQIENPFLADDENDSLDDIAETHPGGLPPPSVCRNYHCQECNFTTTKSKMFLYHQIDVHGANFNVFPCDCCEYASRWKHKLLRHKEKAHREEAAENLWMDSAEQASTNVESSELQAPKPKRMPRYRPSKAVRFKRSRARLNKQNALDVCSPYIEKLSHPDNSFVFKCKLCLYSSRTRMQGYRHVYSCHVKAKIFRCKLCSFSTSKKIEFYAHKSIHTNEQLYQCQECLYSTTLKTNFDRHMLNHETLSRFVCNVCSYSTSNEGALKRHLTNHHSNTNENVSLIVGSAETTVVDEPAPELIEQNIDNTSDWQYKTEDRNVDFNLEEKEASSSLSNQYSKSYCYRCRICGLEYKRSLDMNRHMRMKHNLGMNDLEKIDLNEDLDEQCRSDDTDINDRGSIVPDDEPLDLSFKSMNNVIAWGKSKLKCTYCSYIAKWPCDLRRHLAVHSVDKRYRCHLCMKKYKFFGDLNIHIRRDHKSEPDRSLIEKVTTIRRKKSSPIIFKCPTCSFTSQLKSEIDRHSKLHKESKPYKCALCDYQTHWKGDIKRHLYRHHPEQVQQESAVKKLIIHQEKVISANSPSMEEKNVEDEDIKPAIDVIADSLEEDTPLAYLSSSFSGNRTPTGQKEEEKLASENSEVSPDFFSADKFLEKEGIGPFKCHYCDFTAPIPSKLKAHLSTHANIKKFKCPVCGKRSNWKWDIRKHIRKEHPGRTEDVEIMPEWEARATIFKYMETMPTARREHHLNAALFKTGSIRNKLFKCSWCSFSSPYRMLVSKHIRAVHERELGGVDTPMKEEQHSDELSKLCDDDDQKETIAKTPDPSVLQMSQQRMTSILAPVHQEAKIEKPFMCPLCGKRSTFRGDIKKHYKYIHPNEEVRVIFLGELANDTLFSTTKNKKLEIPNTPPKQDIRVSSSNYSNSVGDLVALEARYSNPKRVGYIKPFKCSSCGRRSNWKWDMRKHIRERHQDEEAYVIVMEEEEARATVMAECFPKHLQASKRAALANSPPVPSTSVAVSSIISNFSSPVKTGICNTTSHSPWRQFKCSLCGYRSNWRSDVHRHIKRRHNRNRAKLIVLDAEIAQMTLSSYSYKRSSKRITEEEKDLINLKNMAEVSYQPAMSNLGKVWKCNKCTFRNKDKMAVLRHLSSHKIKPYKCKVCGHSSNYRSALYRHLRQKHGRNDYSLCKLSMSFALGNRVFIGDDETQATTDELEEAGIGDLMDLYTCNICKFQSTWKACVYRHLRERHGTTDYKNCSVTLRTSAEIDVSETNLAEAASYSGMENYQNASIYYTAPKSRRKMYSCTVCPYVTQKPALLKFHMSYHRPRGQNRFKCKFCPYYVCARRLLNQHLRLHSGEPIKRKTKKQSMPTPLVKNTLLTNLPVNPIMRTATNLTTSRRYQCEKCPYSTNSKNDFLYHKQFHRPKAAAEFKCDYCDYWVSHRRLLKQHLRLHKMISRPHISAGTIHSSPSKSEVSETSQMYDIVEMASLKQRLISTKILPSLAHTSPAGSPLKIATRFAPVGNKPGYILKNGTYKKLLRCHLCPYTNIRTRNLRLHEMMHGPRESTHPLLKCPHCDYYVGSKGLLSHHLKVHQQQYVPDPNDNTISELEQLEDVSIDLQDDDDKSSETTIPEESRVDALLEIARFKKFNCEKCPYASAKRSHFERHLELHGSRQRHTCEYCDYSVPSNNLLVQHRKLHFMPNQNLLASQSIANLQHLPEIPADIALASVLPPLESKTPVPFNVTHDHLKLYENTVIPEDSEIKKLYRCDRCPYANTRRDHMLTHLKFHMVHSELVCPYCDYSVSKQHLLTQHVRVHFSPLPELANWLNENGQKDRVDETKDQDISEALEIAQLYQVNVGKSKIVKLEPDMEREQIVDICEGGSDEENDCEKLKHLVCQYCDRIFEDSACLLKHEKQHLIGNQFEQCHISFPQDNLQQLQAAEGEEPIED